MVTIITPRFAMDLRQTLKTADAETYGYNLGIISILKILEEIALGGKPVILAALTKLELSSTKYAPLSEERKVEVTLLDLDDVHDESFESAWDELRGAAEQLVRLRKDEE